jgi:glycosyltransferase involved in cell wall biosynthesis
MRICMFSLTECNENYNTVRRQTRSLAEAGHDIRVIAYRIKKMDPYEESDGARIFRIMLYPIDPKILRPALLPVALLYRGTLRAWGFLKPLPSKVTRKLLSLVAIKSMPRVARAKGEDKITHGFFLRLERKIIWRWYTVSRYVMLLLPYIYAAYLVYYFRSLRVARREPADVYHAHDLVTLPVAWLCSRLAGGKLVYDSHELWLDRPRLRKRSRLNRFVVRRIESFLIRRTDANIVPGESVGQELSRRYNIVPTVILNAPYYRPFQRSTVFYDELGVPAEERIALYAGKVSWGRGIERGIQGLKYLHQVSYIVLGSGPDGYISSLKKFIESEGLTDRVYFFEEVPFDEVTRYAMSADVGLVLYQNVGLNYYYVSPNKLFECMAAGLPVVGSNFPDLKKYIEGYNFGVTCDPDSPKKIADAINYILSDERRYEEMRRNALEAAKVFNWENESNKLLALYEVLSSRKNV